MVFLFSTLLGYILAYGWEYFCIKIIKKTSLLILGYRLHHSIIGLIIILLGMVSNSLYVIGIGVGVIMQHTITDGFRFVSKEE
jgi:hypothetical protein